jgi:dTMP kinase
MITAGGHLMPKGVFLVIDGSDGSGKGTQYKLLQARLQQGNIPFESFDFPQYGRPSAYFVEQYLNGHYGSLDEVPAERASIFYALDRYEASFAIRSHLAAGKVVIANRFTASNLAHQGAKIAGTHERLDFFADIEALEHTRMNIPQPDCNVILLVPPEIGQQNVDKKNERTYTKNKRDIHETDLDFLRRSVLVYAELCALFPSQYIPIDCMEQDDPGRMKPVERIHELIWQQLAKRL